jgi:hypothetical protein
MSSPLQRQIQARAHQQHRQYNHGINRDVAERTHFKPSEFDRQGISGIHGRTSQKIGGAKK